MTKSFLKASDNFLIHGAVPIYVPVRKLGPGIRWNVNDKKDLKSAKIKNDRVAKTWTSIGSSSYSHFLKLLFISVLD